MERFVLPPRPGELSGLVIYTGLFTEERESMLDFTIFLLVMRRIMEQTRQPRTVG